MEAGVTLIEEVRDGRVHALHTGHAVHLDVDGKVIRSWGDASTSTYWRSAPKPVQAIPFARILETLGLGQRHLALACASHSGEQVHTEIAAETLDTVGLDASALQCAAHPTMTKHSLRGPDGQQAIHNNCSGKHAAMLAVCRHHGWPTETYRSLDHPLQQEILSLFREATGSQDIETGIDGCGLPTYWLPIAALGRTYQWLARHDVGRHCLDAMASEPYLVAGRDRFCTDLMTATNGRIIGKVGAAGVYVLLHRISGESVAIKMVSGVAKAAESVAAAMATSLGWLDGVAGLEHYQSRPIANCAGVHLGTWEARL